MIYFDNNSTTKMDQRVIVEMIPYMTDLYANPSSSYKFGLTVKRHLDNARVNIGDIINATGKNLIFTSSATEAINLAIKGLCYSNKSNRKKIALINTEHKAVIETYLFLESIGYEVVFIPVKNNGLVDLETLNFLIDESTFLVSSMYVNNETGVILPIPEIAELVKSKGCFLFCDATQAVGKIEVNIESLNVDMLCFSGHKFYGPKGAAVLYLSDEIINKNLIQAQIVGGGQEFNLRSGTQNVAAIMGLNKALEIVKNELHEWKENVGTLRNQLESELLKIEGAKINGDIQNRVYNTTNVLIPKVDYLQLEANLSDFCFSNGSACSSRNISPSHVLLAMGLNEYDASNSIRLSLGHLNTYANVA